MCHDDHKEYEPSDLLAILKEAWNVRTPPEPTVIEAEIQKNL